MLTGFRFWVYALYPPLGVLLVTTLIASIGAGKNKALTHNLGTLAYITIWNAFYERTGTETLTIDPEYIVVVRRVGRFKREHRIGRKIIEVAELLGLPAVTTVVGTPMSLR